MKHRARCTAPRADDGVAPREGRAPDRHLERAVGGFWLIDLARGAPRDERHHVHDRFDAPFVADDVNIAARIDEPRPSFDDLARTLRIIGSIQGQRAGLDDHEARPRVRVPAEGPPGAILFSKIQISDSPFVLISACQLLEYATDCASIGWNCPTANTVLVTPFADVATAATEADGLADDAVTRGVGDDAAPGGAPPHVTRSSAMVIEPS